jgi:predicted solute-binding protein
LKSLRIGCVKYFNAQPLIRGWLGDVDFDHPSALCNKLARGELDIALASSFEFLRNPVYRIVDDVSISSAGPVYSVVVAHRGEISEIEEIELDPASETSVNLLRYLLAKLGLNPRLRSAPKAFEAGVGSPPKDGFAVANLPATLNARLLIGDQAIRFRQKHAGEFHFWDLGEQWNKLVDLPFVYALWLIRPEVRDSKPLAERLRKLRDENLADIDKLAAQEKEFDRDFCRRYYGENLRFSFGEKEKAGLREFNRRCREQRLLPLGQLDAEFTAVDFSLRCV